MSFARRFLGMIGLAHLATHGPAAKTQPEFKGGDFQLGRKKPRQLVLHDDGRRSTNGGHRRKREIARRHAKRYGHSRMGQHRV